ncbi:MAG: thymidylate synthase [Candidatus Woesearchaeota archaeon]
MFEPLYKNNQLILGNKQSPTAVICLWSKKEEIAKKIDSKYYCVIGQLYSAERGVDFLIRNLLSNPDIINLVITGNDFSNSGIVLRDFFKNGFKKGKTKTTGKEVWKIISKYEGYIENDLPEDVLNELRDSIIVEWVEDISKLPEIEFATPKTVRPRQIFEKKEEGSLQYVGENSVYVVRGKNVASVWLQILDIIMKFGTVTGTHYDSEQKEIMNLLSIITDEDPDKVHIPEFFPFNKQHFENYLPRILTDARPDDVSYTYGMRMRSHFGIDQVDEALKKLSDKLDSRAVVINLWDSKGDLTKGGSPCLNHLWLRVRDDKFHLTITIRSNDMFAGYPENALSWRILQNNMRKDLIEKLKKKGIEKGIRLGDLIINSQSAHLYDDTWATSKELVDKYLDKYKGALSEEFDPRGNFVITLDEEKGERFIKVQCVSQDGDNLVVFKGTNAYGLINKISRDSRVSLIRHALYLGIELHKAEIALKKKKEYVQDQPLDI